MAVPAEAHRTDRGNMAEVDHRWYLLAGPVLFAVGFYALVVQAHLLRRIMAVNVMGSGVFIVFITVAARTPGPYADPVPHAMVLTGIVVAVCATGLALALADAVQAATGRAEVMEEEEIPERGGRPGDGVDDVSGGSAAGSLGRPERPTAGEERG